MFGLPLLQHFVPAKSSGLEVFESWPVTPVIAVLLALAVLLLLGLGAASLGRPARRERESWPSTKVQPATDDREIILVDGSNVIHWLDNTPQLTPLLQVVHEIMRRGMKPGIVFDANVGYKLTGKFMGERDLAQLLSVPRDQIFVVPKGKQADPYLLETARNRNARIVTNDRYRDWAETHPEVLEPGFLIRGAVQDGKVALNGIAAQEKA